MGPGKNAHTSERVQAEHADVTRRVRELRELIAHSFDWGALGTALAGLEETILRHFDGEEAGGYLREVVQSSPNRESDVMRLFREHDCMRDDLWRARRMVEARADQIAVCLLLESWITLLADHEHRETELVQLVLMADLGDSGGG